MGEYILSSSQEVKRSKKERKKKVKGANDEFHECKMEMIINKKMMQIY
jgi:hypothetical protein